MRIGILFFLLGSHSTIVFSQAARNVKNAVPYGALAHSATGFTTIRGRLYEAFLIIFFLLLLPMMGVAK